MESFGYYEYKLTKYTFIIVNGEIKIKNNLSKSQEVGQKVEDLLSNSVIQEYMLMYPRMMFTYQLILKMLVMVLLLIFALALIKEICR